MLPTIKDIARVTGLSISTISKYLNGGNLLTENQVLIQKAIDDLDFRVNNFARGLKTRKSNMVGIVIPHITNTYFTLLISSIQTLLRSRGYGTILCDCNNDYQLEIDNIEFLISNSVDAIINVPLSRTGDHLLIAKKMRIPIIVLETVYKNNLFNSVVINNTDIIKQATNHLIERGHRNIVYINGAIDTLVAQERLLGYKQALIENNVPIQSRLIAEGFFTSLRAYNAVKNIVKEEKDITALLVSDPEMTVGSLMALSEMKIEIPTDLSFIGFSNAFLTDIYKPKLTVINQPIADIAAATTNMLFKAFEDDNNNKPIKNICLDAELIIGDSVANI